MKIGNRAFDEKVINICATVLKEEEAEIETEAGKLIEEGAQLVEIRVDHWWKHKKPVSLLTETLTRIKEKNKDIPILVTLRSEREGGCFFGLKEEYTKILGNISLSDAVWAIDIEAEIMEYNPENFIEYIQTHGKAVIVSVHITDNTEKEARMKKARDAFDFFGKCECDICKLAVYVDDDEEFQRFEMLVNEYKEMLEERPHIVIAMGEAGIKSRYDREWAGSCITFACGEQPVAPGQLTVAQLKKYL